VEDFSAAVEQMGSSQVERRVEQMLTDRGVRPLGATNTARQTCAMDHGFAGPRPNLIMRWEASGVNRLPDVLEAKISTGRYRTAAVGACSSGDRGGGFTTYRMAVCCFSADTSQCHLRVIGIPESSLYNVSVGKSAFSLRKSCSSE
jgi:hypothetical protein